MMPAVTTLSEVTHPAIHRYRHLKTAAELAQTGQPGFLGLEYEAVLSLLSDYKATLDLLAAKEACDQRQAEDDPRLPSAPATGRRVPTVIDTSPEAESRREKIRALIRDRGLSMTTRPDGLIHIKGPGVDLLVRDLIHAHAGDLRR